MGRRTVRERLGKPTSKITLKREPETGPQKTRSVGHSLPGKGKRSTRVPHSYSGSTMEKSLSRSGPYPDVPTFTEEGYSAQKNTTPSPSIRTPGNPTLP